MYIVKKYVNPTSIVWARDLTLAYRLIKAYPEIEFWKTLPVKHQNDSLAILAGPVSKKKLGFAYKEYKQRLLIQKSIVIPKREEITLGEKVGPDYVLPPRKPKSILDFCK